VTGSAGSLCLGIDLGGTKIALALVDDEGGVHAERRVETAAAAGAGAVIAAMVEACQALLAGARVPVLGIGVGVAGQVDAVGGVVRSTPNLAGWHDVPLAARLADALGLATVLTNDVHAVTLAEQAHGAGRGSDHMAVVFVGTGVGGGVVSGGRLIDGAHGYGGELGHMTLVAGGRPCTCGARGCLEAYVGGWAIALRAQEAAARDPEAGRALVREAGTAEQITAATVDRTAEAGDPLAVELAAETGRLLGHGLVSVVHAFNPRRLVLGGGVIEGMPALVSMAADVVRNQAMAVFLEDLEIVPAELGREAGVVGAACLVRNRARQESTKGAHPESSGA